MRIILDAPQPIEKLRAVYNDKVTFITSTSIYPMVEAIEIKGDYLSSMKKRAVPVRVGKKIDKEIKKYQTRLLRAWRKSTKELLNSLRLENLSKSIEKAENPEIERIVNEKNPTRRAELYAAYLLAHKGELLEPEIKSLKEALQRAAEPSFRSVYIVGKNRGQVLTNQELSDDITGDDLDILTEKAEWNEEFIDGLGEDVLERYTEALQDKYDTDDDLLDALEAAPEKESHRLALFAAAAGSILLASGMAQASRDVRAVDPETGEPTDLPRLDPDTDLPLGDVIVGGIWHTSHDDSVCDGCEAEDGRWMTWEEFEAEAGTNDCLTRCRCIELFEPTEEREKAARATDLAKDTKAQIEQAARQTDKSPTEEQKENGNYKKGHVNLHGLDISIENPKGSTRSGVSRDGKRWSSTLAHHYGYIRQSEGGDGDHVDVFIGPSPDSKRVFIVDQIVPATGKFDEHKVMLGFGSAEEAREGYLANYEKGWKGIGAISEVDIEPFKDWVHSRDAKKPVDHTLTKHLMGQHDQADHSPTGAPAKEPEAKAPTATAEARTTEAGVGQRWLSQEDWGKEFKDAVEKEINLAAEHRELVPKLDENTVAAKVGTFAKNAYETGSKHADNFIPLTEKRLAEVKQSLATAKERIAHGEPTLVNIDYLETTEIPTLEQRLKDYHEEKVHYSGTEIRDRLMEEVNLSVTALTAANSLEEQKAVARKLESDLYKNKEELYDSPTRNPIDYEVSRLHHAAIFNMRTEIEKMDTETLKGYMDIHSQEVRDQWQSQSPQDREKASAAYAGGRITPTVQQNKAFQEGKTWLENNVSPHLMVGVEPVKWQSLRGRGSRAHYLPGKDTIEISNGWRETPDTIPHEFMHHVEHKVPQINQFFVEYYNRRTAGETPIPMRKFGSGYQPYEHTRPDKFAHPYMGHINLSRGRYIVRPEHERPGGEIFSAAVGMFSQNKTAVELYRKDPELFGITAAILKGWRPSKVQT